MRKTLVWILGKYRDTLFMGSCFFLTMCCHRDPQHFIIGCPHPTPPRHNLFSGGHRNITAAEVAGIFLQCSCKAVRISLLYAERRGAQHQATDLIIHHRLA